MPGFTVDSESMLHLAGRIAAVGAIIGWTEMLANRRALSDDSLRAWPLTRQRHAALSWPVPGRLLDLLFAYPRVLAIPALGLLASLVLATTATPGIVSATANAIAASGYGLMRFRGWQGLEGADSLYLMIFSAVAIGEFSGSPAVTIACALFIAAQAMLAYAMSGLLKLRSADWRSGEALPAILRTGIYGNRPLAQLLSRHRTLAVVGCTGVIWFEILMALAPFGPPPLLVLFVSAGLLFHVSVSIAMGLGSFVFAFAATYPTLWYLNTRLWS